ncbi:MAG: tail fiber domain-containing protein [Ignavibacterium sp.]|nr:MAG: tail fiber domain-containing protein [Ignavibacterium sp.]
MKHIKFLFATILNLFLINSIVWGQQDTTLVVTSDGCVGIGTTSPRLEGDDTLQGLDVSATGTQTGLAVGPTTDDYGWVSIYGGTPGTYWHLSKRIYEENDRFGIFYYDGSTYTDELVTLETDGNVGIGTETPQARLEVNAPEGYNGLWIRAGDGADDVLFHVEDSDGSVQAMHIDDSGNIGMGTTTPVYPLEMGSGAHVTGGGVWTNASSRQYKENISNLTQKEAFSALEKLKPVKFQYKLEREEQYVGFIAEDVPELLANNDRKSLSPMDIVAVLTKVVQHQQRKIAELEAKINASQ